MGELLLGMGGRAACTVQEAAATVVDGTSVNGARHVGGGSGRPRHSSGRRWFPLIAAGTGGRRNGCGERCKPTATRAARGARDCCWTARPAMAKPGTAHERR